MNAPLDDIRAFMGAIPPAEYEARRRIRTCRNAGNLKATRTASPSARTLAWLVTETATAWLYAPATVDQLNDVSAYLVALLKAADQAEELEVAS
jgi:aryl-alcohol dehydrogenase-like predicted oxidoreductase